MCIDRLIIGAALLLSLTACQPQYLNGLDGTLQKKVEMVLASSKNAHHLRAALKGVGHDQRKGMAFLIANMPKSDADTLSSSFLIEQVSLAYRTKELFSWTKELPDSIFLNEVLPYASVNERRENWRAPFLKMLYPVVKDCKDMRSAVYEVNKSLKNLTGVEYSTKRKYPNQSPSESLEIGIASCSGLSILLTNAFRAVGIPSRLAGTPLWVSKEGNHSWSEVYIEGKWYFTEYYFEDLDKAWFLHRAGAADKSKPIHCIYATSFKKQNTHFPMSWAKENQEISAVDVTDRYIMLSQKAKGVKDQGVPVIVHLYKNKAVKKLSEGRIRQQIRIKDSTGKQLFTKNTAGPRADMNDYLIVRLPKDQKYIIQYENQQGICNFKIDVKDFEQTVELFYDSN